MTLNLTQSEKKIVLAALARYKSELLQAVADETSPDDADSRKALAEEVERLAKRLKRPVGE
jgi:hypothetical protein